MILKRFVQLLVIFILSAHLYANDWQVDKSADNSVVFQSSTTLLDFEGTTDDIDGYIYWEGYKFFGDKNEFYFEVHPATFNTGIGKRDRDMREDVLETNKFPVASFSGQFIKVEQKGNIYNVVASGDFTLHGQTKKIDINAVITLVNGVLNVKCDFSILLDDYDIDAPNLLAFIKVAQEIKLSLDFNLVEMKK